MREFQQQVLQWFKTCFGDPPDPKASNAKQRAARFAEESIETLQAAGLSRDEVMSLVDYVYSRPVGDLASEIGGALTTIAALAHFHGMSLDDCAEAGIKTLYDKIEKVRAKHRSMPDGSVLPGADRG